jgi:DNA polymerase I-like protein with 3'-5' exonuclease and polymerase domains
MERLHYWLEKIRQAELTCIDTETTGLEPLISELVGISLATGYGHGCYIPLAHTTMRNNYPDKQLWNFNVHGWRVINIKKLAKI